MIEFRWPSNEGTGPIRQQPVPAHQPRVSLVGTLTAVVLVLAACGGAAVEDAAVAEGAVVDDVVAEHGHAAAEGEGELLRVIMQRLNADMSGISQALWLEDWETMTTKAASIAEHAPIAAEELERIHSVLGDEMHAFEEADEVVHAASVRMNQAASTRDLKQFLAAFIEVQQGCVSCHTSFRDRLRTVP